jgi:hypothetical protein
MKEPDFYLSSSEYETWSEIRRCFVLDRLQGPRPRGYWWVKVEPPVPASTCGTTNDVTELVLAERYREDNIASLGDQPVLVYVCIILNHEAVENRVIEPTDIRLVAWAEVAQLPSSLPTVKER